MARYPNRQRAIETMRRLEKELGVEVSVSTPPRRRKPFNPAHRASKPERIT